MTEDAVTDVSRKQLQQQLMLVNSNAETFEIVEKLKTLEHKISILKSSYNTHRNRPGMSVVWIFFSCDIEYCRDLLLYLPSFILAVDY